MPCIQEADVADCQAENPEPKKDGVCCLGCGGRWFRVLYVRHVGSRTLRMKQCRHCGRKVRVSEKIEGDGT